MQSSGKTTLRDIQQAEASLLRRFAAVCEKHGLRYYLVGGTLLGAVRHRGFIPWDDDVDVAMPREDYDAFASLCRSSEGDPSFFYQDPTTDDRYYLPYAKIRREGTYACEPEFPQARSFHRGVFIDLFPLDPCPKRGAFLRFSFHLLSVLNTRARVLTGARKPRGKGLPWRIAYALSLLIPKKRLHRVRSHILASLRRHSDGKTLASFAGAYGYPKEIFDREIFGEGTPLLFEGEIFRAPTLYARQLRQIYGASFLEPPDPRARRTHIDIEHSFTEVNE